MTEASRAADQAPRRGSLRIDKVCGEGSDGTGVGSGGPLAAMTVAEVKDLDHHHRYPCIQIKNPRYNPQIPKSKSVHPNQNPQIAKSPRTPVTHQLPPPYELRAEEAAPSATGLRQLPHLLQPWLQPPLCPTVEPAGKEAEKEALPAVTGPGDGGEVTTEEWPRWGTSSPLPVTVAAVVRELLERRRRRVLLPRRCREEVATTVPEKRMMPLRGHRPPGKGDADQGRALCEGVARQEKGVGSDGSEDPLATATGGVDPASTRVEQRCRRQVGVVPEIRTSASDLAQFLRAHRISHVCLRAIIGVPNYKLLALGSSLATASAWVARHVLPYAGANSSTPAHHRHRRRRRGPHRSPLRAPHAPPGLLAMQSYSMMQSNGVIPLDNALFKTLPPSLEMVDLHTLALLHYTNMFDVVHVAVKNLYVSGDRIPMPVLVMEDLLVSVTSNEELPHMRDEYDHLRAARLSTSFWLLVSTVIAITGV
uniref:Uncharacterized protein n=1 Tax=Oryza sativa subsp. japonica TaxID=39947 RepID=Q6Z3L5_ORYSJ|nr:hypothetical protein [Oryza sativa Japonica Group]